MPCAQNTREPVLLMLVIRNRVGLLESIADTLHFFAVDTRHRSNTRHIRRAPLQAKIIGTNLHKLSLAQFTEFALGHTVMDQYPHNRTQHRARGGQDQLFYIFSSHVGEITPDNSYPGALIVYFMTILTAISCF